MAFTCISLTIVRRAVGCRCIRNMPKDLVSTRPLMVHTALAFELNSVVIEEGRIEPSMKYLSVVIAWNVPAVSRTASSGYSLPAVWMSSSCHIGVG